MTHVSKQQLEPEHLDQLFIQLSSSASLLTKKTASGFLDDLLGHEEKIMLAKRLAAIVMLIEGNSSYRIWQLLKMSPSTTDKIRLNYEIGKYKNIERIIKSNKTSYEQFWKTLEIILQANMPPIGRGRWKSVLKRI
ncbi:hypothetical protein H6784_02975 [Candidatus Nomurabacteria bacterium]|nr:hypothetical protein [Candidatus Kaiserbacteria bacterium]MCB9814356.1 hypothetical protein [Candidatus Nomurabacteria bacterium]